jgi:eukaryotic-like serine/threonine-protein kinase
MPLTTGMILAGRYEIEYMANRGGQSRVYKGRDRETGQGVAIKVLDGWSADDPAHLERFREEALRTSRAALPRHPGIVEVLNAGGYPEEGLYYIVMEWIDGTDLAGLIKQQVGGPPQIDVAPVREQTIVRDLDEDGQDG